MDYPEFSIGNWNEGIFTPLETTSYIREINKFWAFQRSWLHLWDQMEGDPQRVLAALDMEDALLDQAKLSIATDILGRRHRHTIDIEGYENYLWLLSVLDHLHPDGDLLMNNRCRLLDSNNPADWLIAQTLALQGTANT